MPYAERELHLKKEDQLKSFGALMSYYLALACIAVGFMLGIASGLTPGLHVNNFAAMLLALFPQLLEWGLEPQDLAFLILSASISQTFLDTIPAIFLGAPDPDTVLAVLPGHLLMMEGRGMEAVRLCAMGSAGSILVSLAMVYPLALLFGMVYDRFIDLVGWLLAGIAILMIVSERGVPVEGQGSLAHLKPKILALLLFLVSGFLGYTALETEELAVSPIGICPEMLLPLLSGLFGASFLILSLFTDSHIPEQHETGFELQGWPLSRSILLGGLAGSVVAWIPGISPAVATVATRMGMPSSEREFLVSISGVNTSNAVLSLVALYVIDRPRSGAAAAIKEMVNLDLGLLMQMLIIIASVAVLSYLATIYLGSIASRNMGRLNYRYLGTSVLLFLILMSLAFTGIFGLLIFTLSTLVGLIAPIAGIRKTHAMGVLMLPLMLYYLGI